MRVFGTLVLLLGLAPAALSDTLKKVFIFTRHGARTPYTVFPLHEAEWNCSMQSAASYVLPTGPKDTDVQKNINTGFVQDFDLDTSLPGNCYLGQLTAQGLYQHRVLGLKWLERYVLEQGLLPAVFDPELVYLRSTDIERTKQSLMGQILGMYGDALGGQNPLIHLAERDTDALGDQTWCETLVAGRHFLELLPENQEIFSDFDPRLQELEELLGIDDNGLPNADRWYNIWDNLIARRVMQIDFPEGVTDQDLQIGQFVADEITRIAYCTDGRVSDDSPETVSERFSRAIAGVFMGELERDMLSSLSESGEMSSKRLFIYSSHDTTIQPLMSIFAGSAWDCRWPKFASAIQLEIYERVPGVRGRAKLDNFYVHLIYNDDVIHPEYCAGDDCTLSEFLERMRHYKITREEWGRVCAAKW